MSADLFCSQRDCARLANRARIARRAHRKTRWNPFWPGIRCAGMNCRKMAKEGYYFCSQGCAARPCTGKGKP